MNNQKNKKILFRYQFFELPSFASIPLENLNEIKKYFFRKTRRSYLRIRFIQICIFEKKFNENM